MREQVDQIMVAEIRQERVEELETVVERVREACKLSPYSWTAARVLDAIEPKETPDRAADAARGET